MNTTKQRKQYTAEFKAQAIELMAAGRPVAELAEELYNNTNLLYSWRSTCAPCDAKSPSSARRTTF